MNGIVENSIKNYRIYIAEKHHHVLLPWAKIKRENRSEEILLFSFDHHTDTHEPFLAYCENDEERMHQLVACMNYEDDISIDNAIENLRNDEHIKAAIQSGILYKAFVISHSNTFDDVPESIEEEERMQKFKNGGEEYLAAVISGNYGIVSRKNRHYREADIYIPPFLPEGIYEYAGEYDDVVLEDCFLEEKMDTLVRMCPNIFDKDERIKYKYILDIDLDYFHTMKSINPKSMEVFSRLVKGATAITIAKESACVGLVKTDKRVTSKVLLKELLVLLKKIIDSK